MTKEEEGVTLQVQVKREEVALLAKEQHVHRPRAGRRMTQSRN